MATSRPTSRTSGWSGPDPAPTRPCERDPLFNSPRPVGVARGTAARGRAAARRLPGLTQASVWRSNGHSLPVGNRLTGDVVAPAWATDRGGKLFCGLTGPVRANGALAADAQGDHRALDLAPGYRNGAEAGRSSRSCPCGRTSPPSAEGSNAWRWLGRYDAPGGRGKQETAGRRVCPGADHDVNRVASSSRLPRGLTSAPRCNGAPCSWGSPGPTRAALLPTGRTPSLWPVRPALTTGACPPHRGPARTPAGSRPSRP